MRWGWIWDNPAERTRRIVTTPAELHPPTPTELRFLLDDVGGRDAAFHLFLHLAAYTGARRAQLLALRWRNIRFDTDRISFCAGWVEGPSGPVLTTPKTKRSHVVDLDADSFALLADYTESTSTTPEGFVFSDDDGTTAWKPNTLTKTFLLYRRAAGLRPFRLHALRHFMATEMLEAGVPIATVSRRLDHRRVSTTLDNTPTPSPEATHAHAQSSAPSSTDPTQQISRRMPSPHNIGARQSVRIMRVMGQSAAIRMPVRERVWGSCGAANSEHCTGRIRAPRIGDVL